MDGAIAPKFAYTGDHEDMVAFGVRFPIGQPVEVADAKVAEKLRGNRHWVEMVDGAEVVADAPRAKAAPASRARAKRG